MIVIELEIYAIDAIILVMRSVFGKYLALSLALIGVIILVIVVITVVIHTFGYTNSLVQSLFNIIRNWTVAFKALNFIADWAEVLTALAVCLVLMALFANFRQSRRNRALGRLHDWAKNAVVTLAEYRQRDSDLQDSPLERYEEIRALMDELKANCRGVLADARVLGGEVDANTKRMVNTLFAVDEKVQKHDESVFEDLRTLQHNLADVMIVAFDSLRSEKYA